MLSYYNVAESGDLFAAVHGECELTRGREDTYRDSAVPHSLGQRRRR